MDPSKLNKCGSQTEPGMRNTCSPKTTNIPDSSSKERKILPGRRHQRHSTEIGGEYHRWWVVRNALGFETNEHIAGLLLDGFHAVLQQIVLMCGGEAYNKKIHGKLWTETDIGSSSHDTSSSYCPPGRFDETEEFTEYRNEVMFYCDSIWRMCGQQDSRLQELDRAGQPLQDFIIRLMGYLKTAKGKSFGLNYRKRRFKSISSGSAIKKTEEVAETNHLLLPSSYPQAFPFFNNDSLSGPGFVQFSKPTVPLVPAKMCPVDNQQQQHEQPGWMHGRFTYMPSSEKYYFDSSSDLHASENTHKEVSLEEDRLGTINSGTDDSHMWESLEAPGLSQEQQSILTNSPQNCHQVRQERSEQELQEHLKQEQVASQPCRQKRLDHNQQHQQMHLSNWKEIKEVKALHDPQTNLKHHRSSQCYRSPTGLHPYQKLQQVVKHQQLQEAAQHQQYPGHESKHREPVHPDSSSETSIIPVQVEKEMTESKMKPSSANRVENIFYRDSQVTSQSEEGPLKSLLKKPVTNVSYSQTKSADGVHISENAGQLYLYTSCEKTVKENQSAESNRKKIEFSTTARNEGNLGDVCVDTAATLVATSKVTNRSYDGEGEPFSHDTRLPRGGGEPKLIALKPPMPESKSGCSRRSSSSDSFPLIRPAMYQQSERRPISTPLGTPLILLPTQTLSSKDTSLASLPSLVQNIVYNSHGTVLKPLSLVPALSTNFPTSMASDSVGTTLLTRQEDLSVDRSPPTSSLPTLSGHRSSSKSSLLPMYISSTGMNILSLSQPSANSSTVTSSVFSQSVPGLGLGPRVAVATSTGQESSRENRFYSNETSVNCQDLRITNVRSCSSEDYTNVTSHMKDGVENYRKCILTNDYSQHAGNAFFTECRGLSGKKIDLNPTSLTKCTAKNKTELSGMIYSESCSNPETTRGAEHGQIIEQTGTLSQFHACSSAEEQFDHLSAHSRVSGSNADNDLPLFKLADGYGDSSETTNNVGAREDQDICPYVSTTSTTNVTTTSYPGSGSKVESSTTHQDSSTGKNTFHKSPRSRRLVCSTCQLVFFSGTDLLVHRYDQHSHVCKECDGRFLSLTRLEHHKAVDHPTMMLCHHCRFHTFSKETLVQHLRDDHGTDTNGEDSVSLDSSTETKDTTNKHFSVLPNTTTNDRGDASHHQAVGTSQTFKVRESLSHVSRFNNKQQGVSKDVEKHCQSGGAENMQNTSSSDVIPNSSKKESKDLSGKQLFLDSDFSKIKLGDEGTDNYFSSKLPCPGAVFPTFSVQVSRSSSEKPLPESVSSMYSQVVQYCGLDSANLLSLSDSHYSENDEPPQLVIDTEADNCRQDVEELKSKQDVCTPEFEQPLCLVVHNRESIDRLAVDDRKNKVTNKNLDSLEVPTVQRTLNRNVKLCRKSSQSFEEDVSFDNRNESESSIDMKPPVEYENSSAVNSRSKGSVPTEDGREKLIMKISLKQSFEESKFLDRLKGTKKKKKRRRVKSTSCQTKEQPVVEIDIPETQAEEVFFVPDIANSRCLSKDLDTKYHYQSKNMRCFHSENSQEENLGNNTMALDEGAHSLLYPTAQPTQTTTEHKSSVLHEKLLSLRERHIMSSLPPKKRNFKKSSRKPWRSENYCAKHVNAVNSECESSPGGKDSSKGLSTGQFIQLPDDGSATSTQIKLTRSRSLQSSFVHASQGSDNEKPIAQATSTDVSVLTSISDSDSLPCGNSSKSKSEYTVAATRSRTRFTCPISGCGATFSRKWNMEGHLSKVHRQESRLNCNVKGCDQVFSSKKDLRQHITVHHKGKLRKYRCSWPDCQKGFFSQTHLRVHTLTHTGEKPVACEMCDYRCRQRTALIWHMRKHGIFHRINTP